MCGCEHPQVPASVYRHLDRGTQPPLKSRLGHFMSSEVLRMRDTHSSWLVLNGIARIDPSSEASGFPVEGPLSSPPEGEWQAAEPGAQVIRLQFLKPTTLSRVRVVFRDDGQPRTQEFTLGWLAAGEQDFHTIVRQQFNFHPSGATEEVEEYSTSLPQVSALELRIVPDISGGTARARLAEFRVA